MLTEKDSTLKSNQVSSVNSVLSSLYNKLSRTFEQSRETVEPSFENVGAPQGPVYEYTGKRFMKRYFFSFKLNTTNLEARYGNIIIKNLPEAFDFYAYSTNTLGLELKGYFVLSLRNANDIEMVYVPYEKQDGSFYVTLTGVSRKLDETEVINE